jgi:hypothetical protein
VVVGGLAGVGRVALSATSSVTVLETTTTEQGW